MTENLSEKLEQLSAASHEAWQRASRNNALHLGGYSDHAIFDMGWDAAIAHLRSTGQLVAAQADDAIVDRVARAVHDAMVEDEESDAWMSGKCPLDSVTIDGDVNLIKAAKAAISALAAKGDA